MIQTPMTDQMIAAGQGEELNAMCHIARRGTYHAAKHGVIGFTKSAALEYPDTRR
jgi:NAD(P)-dependent dehydrogenase (short-subunit alcohol dehydrogenase family)